MKGINPLTEPHDDSGEVMPILPFLRPSKFVHSEKYVLLLADGLALVGSLLLGRLVNMLHTNVSVFNQFLRLTAEFSPQRTYLFSVLVILILASFISAGHYSLRRPFWDELGSVLKILFVFSFIDLGSGLLTDPSFSRFWYLTTWISAILLVPTFRLGTRGLLKMFGGWIRPCVIIGAGGNAIDAARALTSESLMGYRIGAFLIPDDQGLDQVEKEVVEYSRTKSIPILKLSQDPVDRIKKLGGPHVFVAMESGGIQKYQTMLKSLIRNQSDIYIVPALRGLPLHGVEALHFFSHEVLLLNARNNLSRIWSKTVKRLFDFFVSIILSVLLSPLMLYIYVRVRRDGGPGIYRHKRIGNAGKEFYCLKFRTMIAGADAALTEHLSKNKEALAQWKVARKLRDDPRITDYGKALRKCSLDELPQLWNVIKGEMSLVGPRPITREELEYYGEDSEYYISVRPGITGLWQTSGRNDIDYTSRIALDSWYVRNWSLWYDIVIMIRTIGVVWHKNGVY